MESFKRFEVTFRRIQYTALASPGWACLQANRAANKKPPLRMAQIGDKVESALANSALPQAAGEGLWERESTPSAFQTALARRENYTRSARLTARPI